MPIVLPGGSNGITEVHDARTIVPTLQPELFLFVWLNHSEEIVRKNLRMRIKCLIAAFIVFAIAQSHADVALLLEEPYGRYGSFNPTGHAAIYLSEVCAASPTKLRRCMPGEAGVVISRYRNIAGYDWLAIPLVPYLYAVNSTSEIPNSIEPEMVTSLRDSYRRAYLTSIAPDDVTGNAPAGEWDELIGAAYVRRIYGFEIRTTPEKDDALIQQFNQRKNVRRYNGLFVNCADFARKVINFYEPHAVKRNFLADAGFTTPKQVAKAITRYAHHHREVEFSAFQIPQVPGSIRRSRPVDGVAESLVKTKKYFLPLAILSPVATGGIAVAYLAEGRFSPKRNVEIFTADRAIQQPKEHGTPLPLETSRSDLSSTAGGF